MSRGLNQVLPDCLHPGRVAWDSIKDLQQPFPNVFIRHSVRPHRFDPLGVDRFALPPAYAVVGRDRGQNLRGSRIPGVRDSIASHGIRANCWVGEEIIRLFRLWARAWEEYFYKARRLASRIRLSRNGV
jgi:hypothetical protein